MALSNSAGAQNLSGTCILVLDDDSSMRALIRGALVRCNCGNVLQTGDAREALRLFSSRTIDLVICDWMMEPMSGLAFLRELRLPEHALDVPVIMLSASSDPSDIALAQQFKINGWLVKPIALPQLMAQVSLTLSLSGANLSLDKTHAARTTGLAGQYRAKLVNELRYIDDALAKMQTSRTDFDLSAAEHHILWISIERILHSIRAQASDFGYLLITSVAVLGEQVICALPYSGHPMCYRYEAARRHIMVLVRAMRLVLQNEIHGDGGRAGARMLQELRHYSTRAHAIPGAADTTILDV